MEIFLTSGPFTGSVRDPGSYINIMASSRASEFWAEFSAFGWQKREEGIWRVAWEVFMGRMEMAYSTSACIFWLEPGHIAIFTARKTGKFSLPVCSRGRGNSFVEI